MKNNKVIEYKHVYVSESKKKKFYEKFCVYTK